MSLLNRVKKLTLEWIYEGHRKGDNKNNVSTTVSIRDHEWQEVGAWIWENKDIITGLSVLPFDTGTYIQAPFENISEMEYNTMVAHLKEVDLSHVFEVEDATDQSSELACSGGNCEVTYV